MDASGSSAAAPFLPRSRAESQREEDRLMNPIGKLLVAAAATAMLAGCMHRNYEGVAAGEIAIDSLSATRTAILRVDNASTSIVRVYMKMPGMQPNYVAKALPGQVRSWVLDPNMFPATDVSFEARSEDGTTRSLGPYKINKGETIELVVPANSADARASVHKSTP
jgi:hypothetical protein